MADRHLIVHGHFYQPPRENPWTELIPVEPSAAPFHDWNERITAECYRPNAFARIVDDHGLLVGIVNNYSLLSFNLGPTLAAYLEHAQPEVYRRIIEADTVARGALAQAFHHTILPLCSPRDLRTQIRWGLADFQHRFGRRATGMWLPETAVNDQVLAVLAEEGVRFTVLSPGQAATHVDTTRAYRWVHPDGRREVAIVFYEGRLSHDVAFGLANRPAQTLVDRAEQAAPAGGLVCVATDGETFGHHQRFAERTIAYGLGVEAPRRGLRTGSLEAFLDAHPPTETVRIVESAWSCAHGVGRWKEDCGCHTGGQPGWTQRWRAPLRAALELLRDHAAAVFDERGRRLFADPWAARDAYVLVILGRLSIEEFAATHLRYDGDLVEALTLLECQRHAMAMFTSCGWFFNDLAGIETIIVLRYAARVLDLLREVGDDPPEDRFLTELGRARSNLPEEGDGRQVWARHVLPARVDAQRVVAHLALLQLLEGRDPDGRLGGFEVQVHRNVRADRGGLNLVAGRVTLIHGRTRRLSSHVYVALSFGALEVSGATRPAGPAAIDDALLDGLIEAVGAGERMSSLLRRVAEHFGPHEFGLESVLPDATGEILASTAEHLTNRFAASFERLLDDHRDTFRALALAGYPLPAELRAPAELVLVRRLEAELLELARGWSRPAMRAAQQTVAEARTLKLGLATPAVNRAAGAAVLELTRTAISEGTVVAVEAVQAVMALCRHAGLEPPLDRAQEVAYRAVLAAPEGSPLVELGRVLGLAVDRLGMPT